MNKITFEFEHVPKQEDVRKHIQNCDETRQTRER